MRPIRPRSEALSQGVADRSTIAAQGLQQNSAAAQGLSDARRSAAQSQIADAEAVGNALKNLSTARQNAANVAQQAADQIVAAEKSIVVAQQDSVDAQVNLTRARADSARQREDIAPAAVDSGDSLDSANLRLQQLQLNQAARTGTLSPTDIFAQQNQIDSASNALDIKSATDQVTDAQITHTRAVEDNNTAQQKGVEGSDAVVAAKRAVQTANENLLASEQNLTKTKQNAVLAEQAANDQIAASEQSLADARRQQANDAVTNQENIARAAQNLATHPGQHGPGQPGRGTARQGSGGCRRGDRGESWPSPPPTPV